MENIFEKATREKLRFPYRGNATVEDLWDLNPEALDKIYGKLRAQQRTVETDSLRGCDAKGDVILALQIAVVTKVFQVKQAEREAREAAATRKAEKQKILEIIARKQDQALEGKSLEELTKMVDAL